LSQQKLKEKEEFNVLEKKFQEEKKVRASLEKQLADDKKSRESQERQMLALKMNTSSKVNGNNGANTNGSHFYYQQHQNDGGMHCTMEACRKKARELEAENKRLEEECNRKQDRMSVLDSELKSLAKYREAECNKADNNLIMKLNLMQDKNTSLQESLSAETRFKLDLFSALGEARRQLEFANCEF
jgi:hypothetical protein